MTRLTSWRGSGFHEEEEGGGDKAGGCGHHRVRGEAAWRDARSPVDAKGRANGEQTGRGP